MTPITTTGMFEELDYRECDGLEVSLLWNRREDTLCVFVFDSRTHEALELPVAAQTALDVFQHPFAYAAFQGVEPQSVDRGRSLTCS